MTAFSRRDVLFSGLALTIAPLDLRVAPQQRVMAADDLLSQESAAGYRSLSLEKQDFCVAIGYVPEPAWMKWRVGTGGVLIRELPVSDYQSREELYVRYQWPSAALIRHFGGVHNQQQQLWGEPIAWLGRQPVGWRRSYGRGAIVTLETLLGPHLLAGDREAIRVAAEMVRLRSSRRASAGTSNEA